MECLEKLLLFGGTVQEKDSFTLHIHFLPWLNYLNSVRNNMFYEDPEVRGKATNCMVEYVWQIMTTSYPDLEVTHNKSIDVNEPYLGQMIPFSDQKIRNIIQKTKCLEAKGMVTKCNACNRSFTIAQMINNSLNIPKLNIPNEYSYSYGTWNSSGKY